MIQNEVSQFLPRRIEDNPTMSICTICYGTIVPSIMHRNLREAESAHVCQDMPTPSPALEM
jgi:hypothetical protein